MHHPPSVFDAALPPFPLPRDFLFPFPDEELGSSHGTRLHDGAFFFFPPLIEPFPFPVVATPSSPSPTTAFPLFLLHAFYWNHGAFSIAVIPLRAGGPFLQKGIYVPLRRRRRTVLSFSRFLMGEDNPPEFGFSSFPFRNRSF